MAEMDGISLAEKISITNKSCLFFVTNYEAYFDNASNVRPFRFWTKPIDGAAWSMELTQLYRSYTK